MNFKDGDIVTYRGQKLIFKVIKNKFTGEDIYFLYTMDGKIFTSNFSLDELNMNTAINAATSGAITSSTQSSSSGGGYTGGSSSGGTSRNYAGGRTNNLESSQKLSDDIGSLYETSMTLSACTTLVNDAKKAIETNNIVLNSWNDAKNAKGLATEASIAFLSGLSECFDTVYKNLDSTSKAAKELDDLNKNLKVLLIKFAEKLEKEKQKKEKETELASTPKEIEDGTDENGNKKYKPNPRIDELNEEIKKLTEEITKLESDITTLQNIIDAKYKNMKGKYSELKSLGTKYNGINFEIDDTIFGTSGTVDKKYEMLIKDYGDKLLTVDYNGREYYVTNTAISLNDFVDYINKNNMYQNKGFMGNRCNNLAQIYAYDMIVGSYHSKESYPNNDIETRMKRNETTDKNEALKKIYEEVSSGRPVAIQTTQRTPGLRHFVTVVGFDKSVTSYSDLTPDKLLVLDNVDAKVQLLSDRNRELYDNGKEYQVWTIKDKYLA